MGEIILLLVMFLIFSTTVDMLTSQGQHMYKHKTFIPSARNKHTLKILIRQIIMFSVILFSAYYGIIGIAKFYIV